MFLRGGRALDGSHRGKPRATNQTPNAVQPKYGSQTAGAKLRGREGKSPDRRLRSPSACSV